jgi:hypothetical protein
VTAPVPPDLWDRIQQLIRREIADYTRSGPLRNASITGGETIIQGGALRVLYPTDTGGRAAVYFGDLFSEDDEAYMGTGMLVQDPDGNDIASFRTDAGSNTARAMLRVGDAVAIATDPGGLLAYPMLSGGFHARRFADFRYAASTDTFETVAETHIFKQSARLQVGYRASMDTAATTGEVRILVNGQPFGAVQAHTYAVATRYVLGELADIGDWKDNLTVELQARRTTATGVLRIEPMHWRSWPSVDW